MNTSGLGRVRLQVLFQFASDLVATAALPLFPVRIQCFQRLTPANDAVDAVDRKMNR